MGADILSLVSSIGSIASSVYTIYSPNQSAILGKKIQLSRSLAHTRGVGSLARTNLDEIEKTWRYFECLSISSVEARMLALQQIYMLSDALSKNLLRYSNDY